ncbi:hypothetical protein BpHYR1_039487 [Brachionus plicatilis]|uniref:Uncharacterized protein n=1 Tax=Brachionus plicatilis TaxID=10195 RepID=A0A3M7PCD2_BRAPC|nr:hypothetical protein BpHYR1_039487 [Brachionus plicatilis]
MNINETNYQSISKNIKKFENCALFFNTDLFEIHNKLNWCEQEQQQAPGSNEGPAFPRKRNNYRPRQRSHQGNNDQDQKRPPRPPRYRRGPPRNF